MKWLNRISSLSLIAFSVLIGAMSIKLGFGILKSPGSGFMPFLASAVLFTLSLLVFIMGVVGSREDAKEQAPPGQRNFLKPISLIIALWGYVVFLKALGYLAATFLLMFVMFSISSPKKWYVHLVIAAVVVSLSFLIFYKWLRVELPHGIFHIGR